MNISSIYVGSLTSHSRDIHFTETHTKQALLKRQLTLNIINDLCFRFPDLKAYEPNAALDYICNPDSEFLYDKSLKEIISFLNAQGLEVSLSILRIDLEIHDNEIIEIEHEVI